MSEFTEQTRDDGVMEIRVLRDGGSFVALAQYGEDVIATSATYNREDCGKLAKYLQHYHETGRLFDEPDPERLPVTFKWRYCCDQPEDTQDGMFSWDGIQWHFVARGGSSSIKEFRNAGCIVEKWLTDPPDDLRALVEGGA